jgi:hypothetical protein
MHIILIRKNTFVKREISKAFWSDLTEHTLVVVGMLGSVRLAPLKSEPEILMRELEDTG